ncbi:tetratricopeptide repeat protein [Anatilimnocola floriformis]|uniref:tetratricopeptide repeat protein n=1 Tax=Anatilimnocola floriformis TaxID=2948575 RepID=UPI0020C429CD|nr:tetratricopeptide repeat protein [Anatilimnocola floriformis]
MKVHLINVHSLRFAAVAVLACSLMTGCKSPWGWWGSGSSNSMYGSATPDVSKQKYDGLSQDFSGGGGSAYKAPGAASENAVTSTWKKSTAAVGSAFAWQSKTEKPDDPTSLDSKPKTMGPDVFIAAGRMYETQGKFPEALGQYEKALKAKPNDLASLVSIARLHDRQGNFPKAIEAYNKAAAAHPTSALVQNDIGLCYARNKDNKQAATALLHACNLAPKNPKYRNNLATILVENGQTEEALRHLQALNSPGRAHYNLAFMLTARGKQAEAAQQLQLALQAEPQLGEARELLAQVTGQQRQMQQPQYPQMAAVPQHGPVSTFQASPPQRTNVPQGNVFQPVSQTSTGPVEIVFPTAPANGQQPAAPQVTIPASTEETTFKIGDDESPQLLPPVRE